jgi:hypothetical protein
MQYDQDMFASWSVKTVINLKATCVDPHQIAVNLAQDHKTQSGDQSQISSI